MTATLSAASVTRTAKGVTGRRWTSWTDSAGSVRTSMRVEPGDTMEHLRYLAGVVVETLTTRGGFQAVADEYGNVTVAERSIPTRDELVDLATDPTVTPEQVSTAARGERPMPAAYPEPKRSTNAHTAWSRGFTFAEWRALPRSERMAETLRADGKAPTEEQLANLRLLDGPQTNLLAALRAAR